jgi:hypothetical protein
VFEFGLCVCVCVLGDISVSNLPVKRQQRNETSVAEFAFLDRKLCNDAVSTV